MANRFNTFFWIDLRFDFLSYKYIHKQKLTEQTKTIPILVKSKKSLIMIFIQGPARRIFITILCGFMNAPIPRTFVSTCIYNSTI